MNCPNRKQIVTWLLNMVKTLTIGGFEWTLPHWSVRGLVYIRAIDWFLVIFVREGTEVRSTDYRTMLTLVRAGISRGIKLYVFKNISNKMELSLILSTWETVFDYWLVKAGFHDSTCCIQLFIYSLCVYTIKHIYVSFLCFSKKTKRLFEQIQFLSTLMMFISGTFWWLHKLNTIM